MFSVQKMLNTLHEIKEIAQLDFALLSTNGKVVASTFELEDDKIPENCEKFQVSVGTGIDYMLIACGDVLNISTIGKMAVRQIEAQILSETKDFDRNHFIQNVLLGNLLTIDMHSKAKKLHIEAKPRVTFVIDTGRKSTDVVVEMVKNLSDLKAGDFVTTVDEHSVVLVKDIADIYNENMDAEELEKDLEAIAMSLVDSLQMEAMIKIRVGYGNMAMQIGDIAQSFQEAKMALQVGKVFYAEKDTISYGKLGIGRLIYQLPMSLCDMFIKEVFGEQLPDILEDEESMSTIAKFFENNLNISETARQLYVHRNTLVYRLERIEKAIGLDIRKFEDAMTFRIAIMVLAHVKNHRQQ